MLDDILVDVNRRLDSGKCRKKLNEVLKKLSKKAGKEGIDALINGFFNGRIDMSNEGESRYNSDTGRITLNVNPNREAGFEGAWLNTMSLESIHESLHGMKRSGVLHGPIFKAMARVTGIDFEAFKRERRTELRESGNPKTK